MSQKKLGKRTIKPKPVIRHEIGYEPEIELGLPFAKMKMKWPEFVALSGISSLALIVFFILTPSFGINPFFRGYALAETTQLNFDARLRAEESVAANVKRVADTVADLKKEIIARIIAGNIIAMQIRYCEAIRTTGKQGEADLYNVQIADLQHEYSDYTNGVLYPLRPC